MLERLPERRQEVMNVQEVKTIRERQEGAPHSAAETASNDERFLVAQAKAGRASAFGELYERHRLKIYRTAYRILRNQEDAEDSAQRSFQRAFTNLNRFREDSAFATWVTRIAINEALMLLRHRRANPSLSDGNSHGDEESRSSDLRDNGPGPEEILAKNELRATVTQAISNLGESLRTVVFLRELQGLTSAEAARRLGLSVAAVKARVFHARRHLRRQFERKIKVTRSSFRIKKRDTEIVSHWL
jgi:RNA polymerase sigma-70 factor (ECF subfamily)